MAYTPIGRQRPTVVTAAVYLLYLLAVVQVVDGALGLVLLGDMQDAYETAYGGADGRGPAKVAVIIGASVGVLLALGYGLLGYLNGHGRNGARVTTWVVLGLSVCCFSAGMFVQASPTEPRVTSTFRATRTEITQTVSDMMPAYTVAMFMLATLSLLATILVVVLLALPPANLYFRRPPRQPHPMQGYPSAPHPGQQFPGQPYPGQQQYPGQPYPAQQQYPGQPYRQ